jgi:spermidine synthase
LKKTSERAITRVVIATGISSVVTQLLIIREFLAQFQGNEFVIALVLFNWLFLGGAGTIAAHWITQRIWRPTVGRLGWISLFLAGLSAVQILAVRELRDVFFIHGASVGFYPTLVYTFLTIDLPCRTACMSYRLIILIFQAPVFTSPTTLETFPAGPFSHLHWSISSLPCKPLCWPTYRSSQQPIFSCSRLHLIVF